jgi:hypothetical protein
MFVKTIVAAAAMSAAVLAQGPKLQINLDHLKSKAEEVVNINLDGSSLQQGLKVLGEKGAAEAGLDNLKGVFIRSFQFTKPGEYSQSDVDAVRKQLTGPNWSSIVEVNGKSETVYISLYKDQNNQSGFAILTAEPKELTIVNIVGPIDMGKLGKLGDLMPKLKNLVPEEKKPEEKKKDE